MTENRTKGELIYPPPKIDFSEYKFDAEHTQDDKHPHDVAEAEAREFIEEAYFVIYASKVNSYNFFGKNGASYVQPKLKRIRTAFKSEEYNVKFQKLIEVFENEVGNLQL